MSTDNFERRMVVTSGIQFRAAAAGSASPGILEGYAAKFNVPSADLGGFIEVIKPGAFKRALKLNQDVRALQDHDSSRVLGRTTSGTLSLIEDAVGLKFKCVLPNTSVGRDAFTLVSRRDVTGCSFAFRVANGGEKWTTSESGTIRELTDVDLFDVSPVVTFPAYSDTNVSANSMPLDQASLRVSPRALAEARNRGGVVRRPTTPVVLMDEDDKNQVRKEQGRKLAEQIRADSDNSDTEDDTDTEFNGPTTCKELCNRCFSSGVKRVGKNDFYCGSCGSSNPYPKKGK
jgi:HK97 family phage prohead protease